jgi:hypothetical protein
LATRTLLVGTWYLVEKHGDLSTEAIDQVVARAVRERLQLDAPGAQVAEQPFKGLRQERVVESIAQGHGGEAMRPGQRLSACSGAARGCSRWPSG